MFEYFDIDLTKASFEWDEEKDRINFMKHGIHFRTAVKVFLDPKKMIREDEEHPEELRYDILGRVGKVLFVVCAFRDRNVIRMISARLATAPEFFGMLFVFPDHLFRIQKDFNGSPEMDAMLHEIDPVLLFIPFKGSFRQIYIKMLKHKCLLPVPLYTDATRSAIQFVLQFEVNKKK